MDNSDNPTTNNPIEKNKSRRISRERLWIPIGLILVGGFLLARQMGVGFPDWMYSWQFLFIVIGVFSGLAHRFRGGGWLVMILVGSFFLMDQVLPGVSFHQYLWPLGLIAIGLFLLLRPRRHNWNRDDWESFCRRRYLHQRMRHERRRWGRHGFDAGYPGTEADRPGTDSGYSGFGSAGKNFSSEDFIDLTTVFGGIHKNIVSKDFKGGDITVFMGGAEINLSQADIQGTARLDVTQIMGGTKLIVPAHWEIRSQLTSVFGNVEDKRQTAATNPDKILILDGSSVFGGIEIKNY